jgi:outer membrane protein OmpA-like peptidoglycan-associated protein
MRKKLPILTIVLFLSSLQSQAQNFLGLNTGNYAGVTGVMLQPASIVDSRYKFDINLISTGLNYSNNYFLVSRDAVLKFNKNNFSAYQTFKSQYLSVRNLSAGEKVFFNINNRTQVPLSFMLTTGKKSAIALNIQSRSRIQGTGISAELASMAYNGFYFPPLNNTSIDASGFSLNSLNWVEIGFTYGRVLYSSDKHFVKAAFTGKYLAGIASLNMNSADFRLSVNDDSSININSSNVTYNHNKNADFDMVFDKSFRPDASSFGFDAGLVYEYRGKFDKFKYIRNDDEKSYEAGRRDVSKYIFRLGVSLLDAGMFRFDKPGNVNSFSANINNWNVASAGYNSIAAFDTALANRVVANANDPRSYNVYLPAALSVQFDLKFIKGFYLNAMLYKPVTLGSSAGQRFSNYGFYTITPRWESRQLGIYLPYTITEKNPNSNFKQNMLGATVRLGPLFIGSSNLGTMLFNENLSAADVHVGLKVGITHGKPTKSRAYLEKIFLRNRQADSISNTQWIYQAKDSIQFRGNDTPGRLLIDYSKGKIYDVPNAKGNIIIVNNNYYYNSGPVNPAATADSLLLNKPVYVQTDSLLQQQYQQEVDSIKKLSRDTLNIKKQQLDSLIEEMQLLKNELDSTGKKDGAYYYSAEKPGMITKDFIDSAAMWKDTATQAMWKDTTAQWIAAAADLKKKSIGNKGSTPAANQPGAQWDINNLSQQLANNAAANRIDNKKIREQQDVLLNRYSTNAASLKAEINRLQLRITEIDSRKRAANTVVPVVIPVATTKPQPIPPTTKTDTIYVKDTITLKDTLVIVKTDTITRSVKTPVRMPVSVRRDTVIQEAPVDYTAIPADILLFDLGKSTVRPLYFKRLNYIASLLLKHPFLKATITGHTDKTGSPQRNQELSIGRAKNVEQYLVDKGVSPSRLVTSAVSYLEPAVAGNTKSAGSQNRRVVIKIVNQ